MFFHQLIDLDLGCASYVLGDAGKAIVVDPGLDVDRVLAAAAAEGATITHVLETHVHADHVSGRALLVDRTGARIGVPAGGGIEAGADDTLEAGDVVAAGRVRVEAVAAPGHRPEHLAFVVTDTERDERPCLLLAGDSLLVGDLARPDLAVDAEAGARDLHATVGALLALGDDLEVWPGHVGGSLCGGAALSRRPSSTVGYERRANALLGEADREAFVSRLVEHLPARPPTVEAVVERNRSTAPASEPPPAVEADGLAGVLAGGAVVVDGRPAEAFDAAHVRGSVNLPLGGTGLATRAGWLLAPEAELVVCADEPAAALELARRLRAVGFETVGHATLDALRFAGAEVERVDAFDVRDVGARLDAVTLVDVRDDDEWRQQHVAGSLHRPLATLRDAELPGGPLAVVCASGARAATAASHLRRLGHDARRVAGGGVAVIDDLLTAPVEA